MKMSKLRDEPKLASISVVLILPAFVIGLVGVTLAETQARRPSFQPGYSTIESVELTRSAISLQQEQDDLKRQLSALRTQLDAIQEQAARADSDARAVQERVDELKVDAGLTPRSGPGIVITLDDARLPPTRDTQLVALAIVHSTDITDTLNVAWKAGAVAIAVNGERITGSSACVGSTIQINGTLMSPPFVIAVLGAPEQLVRTFNDPGELSDLRARQRAFGLRFEIATPSDVEVPVYTGPLNVRYARVP